MPIVPSNAGGIVTHTAGYLEQDSSVILPWLTAGLGANFAARCPKWDSFDAAVAALSPPVDPHEAADSSMREPARAVVPIGTWTLLLTSGPLGTDVGMIPSLATREWGCYGIRATCVEDDEHVYPARVLEVFGPDGTPPVMSRRSIVAMNDGGRWIFEMSGEPFEFERLEEYERRRKSHRFTSALLFEYLRHLGVPIDVEPDWRRAGIIEQSL